MTALLAARPSATVGWVDPLLLPLFAGLPVASAEMDPELAGVTDLFEEERTQVVRAVPKRVKEFAAGRSCARRALGELGQSPLSIPSNPDRTARWPIGFTGSITHTRGFAGAVVGCTDLVRAIGIDAEQRTPLGEDLAHHICTEAERSWLNAQTSSARGLLGKVIFSAKECGYKCQYTLSQTFLGFHAMRIEPDLERGRFRAVFLEAAGDAFRPGDHLEGKLVITEQWIVTAICLRQR